MKNINVIASFLNDQLTSIQPAIHLVEEVEGKIVLNGLCPLAIRISNYYDKSNPIEILQDDQTKIGEIVFIKNKSFLISSLPEKLFYCFLIEYPTDMIAERQYTFQNDYILVDSALLSKYLNNLKKTSPMWGGFFHVEDLPNNIFSKSKSISQITASAGIKIDRPFFYDCLELAVIEENPFTRFLKLYHLLELNFDIHTAEKLKDLLTVDSGLY